MPTIPAAAIAFNSFIPTEGSTIAVPRNRGNRASAANV
jgi:hypothetical protein